MDGRSIIDLLKREFSEDVVLRLSNIIKVTSLDDLVIDHFRTCQLKGIYDCLKEIIFYCEVKKLSEDGCCCSDKFTDVIDGPCPVSYTHLDVYKRQAYDTEKHTFQIRKCFLFFISLILG